MHPFIKILYFILILLLISVASNQILFLLLTFLCIIVFSFQFRSFLRTIRRMRWLFLSILIIYAFGTPGELIPQFPVNLAPTFEGVQLGLLQIEKLLIALAALSILLTSSPKEQLMLGLYMLFRPLKFLGLNIEKFSARLLLTLNYVEELASQNNSKFSFKQLDEIHASIESLPQEGTVYFQKLPFKLTDKVMIFFALVFFGLVIFWSYL